MNIVTRFGLERSRFTITIMASLLALGFALYGGFPKREDPVVVIRTAVVRQYAPASTYDGHFVAYDNAAAPIRFAIAWRGRALQYELSPGATATFVWNRP